MNAQKKQLIILAIGGLVLIGVLIFQFTRKEAPIPAAAVKTASTAAPAAHAAAPKAVATPAAKPGAPTQIKKADVNIDDLLAGIKEVDFDYEKDHMPRDPLAPLVGTATRITEKGAPGEAPIAPATATKVMNKIVSGIMWDPKRPMAVVDNLVVYPGYKYDDGITVESIERDRVTFKVGDSLIQVELKEL